MAAAVVVLFTCGRSGPNAIGGTATMATLIGVGLAVYQPGFEWWTIGKAFVIGTFIGLALEMLPRLMRAKPVRDRILKK